MATPLVKICGLCELPGALAAVEAGADLLGFHFCDSSRRMEPKEALRIIQRLPAGPALVGVFIDQPAAEVDQIADYCGLDLVQLHGSEKPGFETEWPVIKALKVRDGIVPDASAWPEAMILLDTWSADQRGGTGRTWNWDSAARIVRERQVFIAGGLNPGNVAEVIARVQPYGVDVSSGVESEPRRKDPAKIAAFIEAVHAAAG